MPGARVPNPNFNPEDVGNLSANSNDDLQEEVKDQNQPGSKQNEIQPGSQPDLDGDDPMSGSECDQTTAKVTKDSNIDYASLPSIEQLLEQNGFGVKFG